MFPNFAVQCGEEHLRNEAILLMHIMHGQFPSDVHNIITKITVFFSFYPVFYCADTISI